MPLDHLQHTFIARLQEHGVALTEQQVAQFEAYYRMLILWNESMNLTGITERTDVYWKHFYDSLTPAFFVDFTACEHVLDVGSGAGFPAFPLKIAFPHISVTVVDSLKKRLSFLQEICQQLDLQHIETVHARAEELGQQEQYREQYELVLARAVARLNVLSEYCLPFTRIGGQFVAMKTDAAGEEIAAAKPAISRLGGGRTTTHTLELPEHLGGRSLIVIAKERATPVKYPRKPGTPAKSPLRH